MLVVLAHFPFAFDGGSENDLLSRGGTTLTCHPGGAVRKYLRDAGVEVKALGGDTGGQ
jgi:hypothetical protein